MSKIKEVPTDSFGDQMVFVDSYGGYLPDSENIPTTTVQHGLSGISHEGDIYCLDCAVDMELVERHNGEWCALVNGNKQPLHKAPWTGAVCPRHETQTQYHCGRHSECLNSLDGDEHPYNHDHSVGIGINEHVIEH